MCIDMLVFGAVYVVCAATWVNYLLIMRVTLRRRRDGDAVVTRARSASIERV